MCFFFYEKEEIKIIGDDDYKLGALKQILEAKLIKRGVSLKALDYQKIEDATLSTKRQVAKLVNGLEKEKAKEEEEDGKIADLIKN